MTTDAQDTMPVLIESPKTTEERTPNKLILCFDGSGNQFSGNTADTNVVKLLNKLDRNHPHQYHYYQSKSNDPPRTPVKSSSRPR
jgi:uncharacterized protein (DUF2235 family)